MARVEVDYSRLRELPEDGYVTERVGSCNIIEVSDDAEGPPEQRNSTQEQEPVQMTGGYVPNLHDNQSEFEMLRGAAAQLPPGVDQIIVTHPPVQSTPINEHMQLPIAIDAFPTLFPNRMADFNETWSDKVSMADWAQHLMQIKGGRFARHPRFRYWVLNTIMCHEAKAKARLPSFPNISPNSKGYPGR